MVIHDKIQALINSSNYISRDLSWLQFNYRVLAQAQMSSRTVFERLKFLAITASNFDEFFMIRIGSLYNYLDFGKRRLDYSGLREDQFKEKLYADVHEFTKKQFDLILNELTPQFEDNGFKILNVSDLSNKEEEEVRNYFEKMVFPMLTPMVYDTYHAFPVLNNLLTILGVVTNNKKEETGNRRKISFVQIPKNLPKFYQIEREDYWVFLPIENIIESYISHLFRNVDIESVDTFRITRNGDFTLDESDDLDTDFLNELKAKLRTRKTGRVVRMEMSENPNPLLKETLIEKFDIEELNIFESPALLDFTRLWQIVGHKAFAYLQPPSPNFATPVAVQSFKRGDTDNIFDRLKKQDILLHHPYNSPDHMLELLEQAADDPKVMAIKMTIYRLAKDSRVTKALLRAVENGKQVSALFEVKARFDEENNLQEAKKLQEAGCFVIYGVSAVKTHTKLMLVVRNESDKVRRYVHLGSGNYNESTAKLYTDIGLISTNDAYGEDVSEFFNAITGHSQPKRYNKLLTAPRQMRKGFIDLIDKEAKNAKDGLTSGIVIKVNSLQDDKLMDSLYAAAQAGVPVRLIVRGICCIRPGRKGLSENIEVKSIVGDYLEHTRLFYFHNNGDPIVYGGSADAMTRSFDRRIESQFEIVDPLCKKEAINILDYNLKDNINSFVMNEDGSYSKLTRENGEKPFDVFKEFYNVTQKIVNKAKIF
ncbi:polyphosphate kinase 1 [Flammeovirga yaeyamensis]|uniref:Polyphosphate kinase n=1 Tax=Flammeovirga yaeyamensis TaxID=367791 RepID=A0AAX1N7N8_9BACT|nr:MULTISPECIES: polyphosphate kinase 1 [Flammeovirga]ANQ49314.1 polyphosphate kinase 1 [Flammeovirga sp. MY04]MBB3697823.1 polyphosphate kinase [Flammeovirga yaeyamensis]NMF35821.1 polyphosphate kinase 1 [Flammeovirga yaeyamensis]QWG03227.1 polyphosphate kinase 1 [Flammeovirga yaeyamensis]